MTYYCLKKTHLQMNNGFNIDHQSLLILLIDVKNVRIIGTWNINNLLQTGKFENKDEKTETVYIGHIRNKMSTNWELLNR